MANLPPGFVLDAPNPRVPVAPRAAAAPRSIPGTGPKPDDPPSGYRWDQGGELTPIPGGPADKPADGEDAPSGYRWAPDGATLVPIPGGPADKSDAANPDARADAIGKLSRVIEQIDRLYSDSSDNGGWGETGWIGSQLRDVGGTAAFDLGQQVQTVEANAAFDALQRMREASPTGGALGAITERELDLLKSSVANINPNQSQNEFIASLARAKGIYLDQLRRLDPALADEIEQRGNATKDENGVITYDQRGRDALAGTVAPDSGGSPPPSNGGRAGFLDQLGTSTKNALVGAAQGAAGVLDLPMDVGRGVERGTNYVVGNGLGALLDAVGLEGAGDWWRRGSDAVDADLASRQGAADMIEQASPTPEGMGTSRFVSQLVGGAMVPIGPKAAPRVRAPTTTAAPTAAREVIDAGRQANVRVMTSDVRPPTTFVGKMARAFGERIPFAGTGGPRAAQQAERVQAVKDLARDFGADVGIDYLDQVADDLGATRGARLTQLTQQKNAIIERVQGDFTAPRTVQAIGEQVRRLASIDAERFAPVIRQLQAFGDNLIGGKSLQQVEANRRLLGDMFEDANLAAIKTDGQKAVNAIYEPLREDMGAFIRQSAGDAAYSTWKRANDQLASLAGELSDSVFRNVLKSNETTPENVARLLFSKKPSEVRRLVGNLSPEGRSRAQAAVINRAIEVAGGLDSISPDKFANEIGRLGQSVGVVFEGADLARLKGLERLLQATKQASVASAAPPTGVQNMPMLMGIGVGASGGSGAALLALVGGAARAYESATMRNLLAGLGMSQPGSQNESKLLERILKVATSQLEIRGPAANDALAASPSRAAASEQENN